jgi:hypothetical protein
MNKRDYMKFTGLLEIVPPKKTQFAAMTAACRNWFLLHPELARMQASEDSLLVCRQYMYIELNREEGPRAHIMDRLYKRYSNLRREIETAAMATLLPEVEVEAAEAA